LSRCGRSASADARWRPPPGVTVLVGPLPAEPLWKQAAALLDLGFSLPPGAPAVGVLVDQAPVLPTAPPAQDAGVAAPGGAAVSSPAGPGSGVLTVAAAAGVGAALAVLVLWLRR
jgi:hypothetical protein